MYAKNAARYRDAEVLSASPAQLIVIVFDHLLVNLRRARMALESGDVEQRCVALDRSRQALGELLISLDRERGGQIAANLSGVYAFILAELTNIRGKNDVQRLAKAVNMVSDLREAFFTVAGQSARPGTQP